MESKTKMSVKESSELAPLSYLEGEKDLGIENIDKSEIQMPRIKIVQALTREKYGSKDGDFIHSVDGKNYGKALTFIPLVHWKSNVKFVKSELICRSMDGIVAAEGSTYKPAGTRCLETCKECMFSGTDKSRPACARTYNYLIAEINELAQAIKDKLPLSPLILYFSSSNTKMAKKLNTVIMANASKNRPIYCQTFTINTPEKEVDKGSGKYFPIEKLVPGNFVTEIQFGYLKALYKEFSKMKLDAVIEKEHEDSI